MTLRVAIDMIRPSSFGFDLRWQRRHPINMSIGAAHVEIGDLISRTPGIKNGSPHLSGTGVLVRTIARWHQSGLLPEEIVAKYGFLRLDQVYAALAYYYANRSEVDTELASLDATADELEAAARA
jgi:uncharacterized protein (DUF433 family)